MIVTLDGPAGTGKSTVSRVLAYKLGLPHLDTGAFYRAATFAVLQSGVDLDDHAGILSEIASLSLQQAEGRTFVNGQDVSEEIRSEAVTKAVSAVSAIPAVRERLVTLQRAWIEANGGAGVVEGRDIGSVVFPEADVKIFLDARPEVRAKRRALQTGESLQDVLADINRRDAIDSSRAASPLQIPSGAIVYDTSDQDFDQVVSGLTDLVISKYS